MNPGQGNDGPEAAPASAALHRSLTGLNQLRLQPRLPDAHWRDRLAAELPLHVLEMEFIETERGAVTERARQAPADPDGFVAWFEDLLHGGPGQGDPLFPWLAERASLADLRWFLTQEVAGEAGFDDLVALAQVKMPPRPKLEMARNYWDEMGRGSASAVHGALLDDTVRELRLVPGQADIVWEARALSNLLLGLSANRCYAYHAVGALGAVELTAPGRVALVDAGLRRLGVPAAARRYFALHATLDVKHAEAWNREVLAPLVAADPHLALPLAEGALLRLTAGARCFRRYRQELGVAAGWDHGAPACS